MATKAALAAAIAIGFVGLDLGGYVADTPLSRTAALTLLTLYAGVPVLLKLAAIALVLGSGHREAPAQPAHQAANQR